MFKNYFKTAFRNLLQNTGSHEQMVTKLSLSHNAWLVAICFSGNTGDIDCVVYDKFSGHKSSVCKPGEEFENGINELSRNTID
jgi:hypothetical protein